MQGEQPPRPFVPRDTSHFVVQFDGPDDHATWVRIRAMLEYAYEEISPKFGHVPARPIKGGSPAGQKFSGPAATPYWAETPVRLESGPSPSPHTRRARRSSIVQPRGPSVGDGSFMNKPKMEGLLLQHGSWKVSPSI